MLRDFVGIHMERVADQDADAIGVLESCKPGFLLDLTSFF